VGRRRLQLGVELLAAQRFVAQSSFHLGAGVAQAIDVRVPAAKMRRELCDVILHK